MKPYLYILLGVWCVAGELTRKSFDGYKVFRIKPKTDEQIALLARLENEVDNLDFWTGTNKAGLPVDVMVPPSDQKAFVNFLKEQEIDVKVFMDNVQE
jgi:Carboxypeptidase activation peptide